MHRAIGITYSLSSHFPEDLHLTYKYQRVLEQLSDISLSDATDIMNRGGKRKRQPIVCSDFTYELEEKRKPMVYSVHTDYSPPPSQLQNMSQILSHPKRCTLVSLENLPSFFNPIASSTKSTFLTSVGAESMGECTRNVMRTLITDEVAITMNWRGENNRVSIACTPLATAIVGM
ncbi:hypothetical protein EG68_12050 [Paragonimus skrjabini miyazakii]|uniref:Uncharacterized protein n=1 Tax=Paragonimus skrjabini miyazakii TaxID=59628 RepID=A0A8S9YFK0_9TREM|nr:hypothetical protein EG68_12050 [Paragonimus skrjabini miyazakii]